MIERGMLMQSRLPLAFLDKMKDILGEEYERFRSSYNAERVYGFRINELKLSMNEWMKLSPYEEELKPIPWASSTGMYYKEYMRPGKHPYYHAGLYYIQEPSAMAPVELLDVQPGHRVLDLCAAPGGKSTQIASKLQGRGVLISNDNARERTKALAKNIELAGVRNAVILNEEPSHLIDVFDRWFDRVIIDAPCSGEGMFRKDDGMIAEWEKHSVKKCSSMQKDILNDAAAMLAPGGKLVYSTCTFSPEENESQLALFLAEHADFEMVQIEPKFGWKPGRPDLVETSAAMDTDKLRSLEGAVRLWPHHIEGEGHFAAVLRRKEDREAAVLDGHAEREHALDEQNDNWLGATESSEHVRNKHKHAVKRVLNENARDHYDKRELREKTGKYSNADKNGKGCKQSYSKKTKEVAKDDPAVLWQSNIGQIAAGLELQDGVIISHGSHVYIQPKGIPSLSELKVIRPGWYVGEINHGRLEPTHPLAMGLNRKEAVRSISWSANDERTVRFLKGETVFVQEEEIVLYGDASPRGYVLICTDGYPIGWAKFADGILNNRLPAGWRWM